MCDISCPNCFSSRIVRNGSIRKNRRYKCQRCDKTFSFDRKRNYYKVPQEVYDQAESLLDQKLQYGTTKMSLREIARQVGLSHPTILKIKKELDYENKTAEAEIFDEDLQFDYHEQKIYYKRYVIKMNKLSKGVEDRDRIFIKIYMAYLHGGQIRDLISPFKKILDQFIEKRH